MHSFGASDAWRCQFVGRNWPQNKKEQIAEWLFSKDFDEYGNPKGIGLSIWRFYIGSGSVEQGESSGITNYWRRAECFLNNDGTYNWEKQQGQQWFLKKAKEFGVEYNLAFTLSPPVYITKNSKAFSPKGSQQLNIKSGYIDEYAHFLVDVCKHFEDIGLPFDYISPFNEPQWAWDTRSQEGTPATNQELFNYISELDDQLAAGNIGTKMVIGEAADIRFLYNKDKKYSHVSGQLDFFFDSNSPYYLGDKKSVLHTISGHSYFTTWPIDTLLNTRTQLRDKMTQVDKTLGYWQSEFCVLEANDEITGGYKRDLKMPTALYVSRVIHYDITIANASSWQWWTAISQYNYKDGLIYIDRGNDGVNSPADNDNILLEKDGEFHDSKLMWAIGNYSRFIRPGFIRISAEVIVNKNEKISKNKTVMVSAYMDPEMKNIVAVFINPTDNTTHVNTAGISNIDSVKLYVTDENSNLKYIESNNEGIMLKPKSVTTVVYQLKN